MSLLILFLLFLLESYLLFRNFALGELAEWFIALD